MNKARLNVDIGSGAVQKAREAGGNICRLVEEKPAEPTREAKAAWAQLQGG